MLNKLKHIKLKLFGDKRFEEKGYKILHCKQCGEQYKSYLHYRSVGLTYDNLCEVCKK